MDRAQETRELDSTLDRMFKNLPSAPFVVTIPSNPQYHRPSDERYKWREHTCFDLDEEHLQYASFRVHQDPDSMLVFHPQPTQKKQQNTATLTPSLAPKKKISLADYAKSKQNGTPLPSERDSKTREQKPAIQGLGARAEHESPKRQDDDSKNLGLDGKDSHADHENNRSDIEATDVRVESHRKGGNQILAPVQAPGASKGLNKRNLVELADEQNPISDSSDTTMRPSKKIKVDEQVEEARLNGKEGQAAPENSTLVPTTPQKISPNLFTSQQPLGPSQALDFVKKDTFFERPNSKSMRNPTRPSEPKDSKASQAAHGPSGSPKNSRLATSSVEKDKPSAPLWALNGAQKSSTELLVPQHRCPLNLKTASSISFLQKSTLSSTPLLASSPTQFLVSAPSNHRAKSAKAASALNIDRPSLSSHGKTSEKSREADFSSAVKRSANGPRTSNSSEKKKDTLETSTSTAKKRPIPEDVTASSAPKRQRANISNVGKAPSTPIGVISSPAANVTPGSSATRKHLTPGVKAATTAMQSSAASTPQGLGRTPNGDTNEASHSRSTSGSLDSTKSSDVWRKENVRLEGLGKRLKKQFEATLKAVPETGDQKKSTQLAKLAAIQGLEGILCFMEAFCALDQFRPSIKSWRSLGGMMEQVTSRVSDFPHILGMLRLLQSTQYSTTASILGKTSPESIQNVESRLEHLSMIQRCFSRAQNFAAESEQYLPRRILSEVYPDTYRETLNIPLGPSGNAMPVLRLATKFMSEWSKHEGLKWSQQLDEGMCSRI